MRRGRNEKALANHEIVTIAVHLLGGDTAFIDTEDIAVKANELAPSRFTWRKHQDQINLEVIRVYLSDAKKPDKGAYLLGSGTDGWMLTPQGLSFARSHVGKLQEANLSRKPLSAKERHWLQAERVRLLSSDAHARFLEGGVDAVSPRQAEAFFRLDAYVTGEARHRKVVRLLNAFGDDPDVGKTVVALAGNVLGRKADA